MPYTSTFDYFQCKSQEEFKYTQNLVKICKVYRSWFACYHVIPCLRNVVNCILTIILLLDNALYYVYAFVKKEVTLLKIKHSKY